MWKSIGQGCFYEGFRENFCCECEVLKAEGLERYRFVNPFAASTTSVDKPEKIDVWVIDEEGHVQWKAYSTGYLYEEHTDQFIKAYYPSDLIPSYANENLRSRFYEKDIIVTWPYLYIDGLGGFGCSYAYAFCLPGRTLESFQTWVFDEVF